MLKALISFFDLIGTVTSLFLELDVDVVSIIGLLAALVRVDGEGCALAVIVVFLTVTVVLVALETSEDNDETSVRELAWIET